MRAVRLAALVVPIASLPVHAGFTLTVPDVVLNEPPTTDQVVAVELYFSDVTPDVVQTVAGWAVRVDVMGGGPGSVRFPETRPTRFALRPVEHPHFYDGAVVDPDDQFPLALPLIPGDPDAFTASHLIAVGLASVTREPPIVLGEGVIRLPIVVPAGATGVFPIDLDELVTSFADPLGELIPGMILDNGSITIVPEPHLIGLLVLGLSAARRRSRGVVPERS